jgi:hypothetical protein
VNSDGATIQVSLRPSWHLTVALALLHLASIVVVLMLNQPWWIGAPLVITICGHAWWAVRRFGRLASRGSVTGIELTLDHSCSLRYRDGTSRTGRIDDSTLVTAWLVVISVTTAIRARKRRAVVTSDMLAAEDFRRLRIALRWGQPAQVPGATQV